MRILFFAHESQLYGANRSLLNLLGELKYKGIKCFVIVPQYGPICDELNKLKIDYRVIVYRWWVSSPRVNFFENPMRYFQRVVSSLGKVKLSLRSLADLKQEFTKYNPDVVYSNSSVIWIGLFMAKLMGKPHAWHIREFNDIDHNLHLDFGKRFFRACLRMSDKNFFISKALKQYIDPGASLGKNVVVYNGVGTLSEFDSYKHLYNRKTDFCFLIIGSISVRKGQEQAILALHQLKKKYEKVNLLVVGKGDKSGLINLVKELDIEDDVGFAGHVNDPHEMFNKAHGVLMCSLNEAFGRVTVEAMMHSLPVIGYDNGGTCEIIKDCKTGFLYRTFDQLVKKMELLVLDRELCKEVGKNAWLDASQRFNSELCAQSIFNELKGLV